MQELIIIATLYLLGAWLMYLCHTKEGDMVSRWQCLLVGVLWPFVSAVYGVIVFCDFMGDHPDGD